MQCWRMKLGLASYPHSKTTQVLRLVLHHQGKSTWDTCCYLNACYQQKLPDGSFSTEFLVFLAEAVTYRFMDLQMNVSTISVSLQLWHSRCAWGGNDHQAQQRQAALAAGGSWFHGLLPLFKDKLSFFLLFDTNMLWMMDRKLIFLDVLIIKTNQSHFFLHIQVNEFKNNSPSPRWKELS